VRVDGSFLVPLTGMSEVRGVLSSRRMVSMVDETYCQLSTLILQAHPSTV
jgi:hypothetical protein